MDADNHPGEEYLLVMHFNVHYIYWLLPLGAIIGFVVMFSVIWFFSGDWAVALIGGELCAILGAIIGSAVYLLNVLHEFEAKAQSVL